MNTMGSTNNQNVFKPFAITRPDPRLMKYYALGALCAGPFFPLAILPLFFKYETLRYKFDESGVSMRWGILFRREIQLTYRRIQDIHLTRNIIQRWMGLATVTVQTASGGIGPQMTIEGILEAEPLRDFLYKKMRGARGESETEELLPADDTPRSTPQTNDEALALLHEIRDLLRQAVPGQGGQP